MNLAVADRRVRSVLVVDDDEIGSSVLRVMLNDLGVTEVHVASGGRDALRTLAELTYAPDLVICDLYMPDMDGIEFMAELATQHYQGAVVLVSGVDVEMLSLAQDLVLADGIRLLGSFPKPLRADTLAAMLKANNP